MKSLILTALVSLVSVSAFAVPLPGMTGQPDASVVQLFEMTPFRISDETTVCKQKALMSNNNYALIYCNHAIGDSLHALTDESGLIIQGYITSEEFKKYGN